MKVSKSKMIFPSLLVLMIAAEPAQAGKGGNGNGKGQGGNGGGGGGSGFDTPVQIHLTITFRDDALDGVQSDGGAYYDQDLEIDGENVDAHIDASAGSNYGNLYLRTAHSVSRSLYLDISDCLADCDNQPFSEDFFHNAGFTVAATEAQSGGFCGMESGQIITAPMEVTYFMDGVDHPGFVFYEPGLKGKSPCRGNNGSSEVSVQRHSDTTWTVSGDVACVAAPDGSHGGLAFMPFEFDVVADQSCQ